MVFPHVLGKLLRGSVQEVGWHDSALAGFRSAHRYDLGTLSALPVRLFLKRRLSSMLSDCDQLQLWLLASESRDRDSASMLAVELELSYY